jgi:hypothetical protein
MMNAWFIANEDFEGFIQTYAEATNTGVQTCRDWFKEFYERNPRINFCDVSVQPDLSAKQYYDLLVDRNVFGSDHVMFYDNDVCISSIC